MTTIVTECNLVSIPSDIIREFNIRPGTRLEWKKALDGVIAVKPLYSRGELARQLYGAGRHRLQQGDDPIRDLVLERENDDKIDQAGEQ